jgi:alkyl sulfatase BDS1-like metallo-beta-lactamase superfamily hydrolase
VIPRQGAVLLTAVSFAIAGSATAQSEDADLTVTIDRSDPETVMMGEKTLMAQIDDGVAKTTRDESVLEKLASTLVQF